MYNTIKKGKGRHWPQGPTGVMNLFIYWYNLPFMDRDQYAEESWGEVEDSQLG